MKMLNKTKSILIAAQDLRLAGLIEEYLSTSGYDVLCEFNVDAALEKLMKTAVDLVIVDGELPRRVFRNFVETAAKVKPGVPLIAVGLSDREEETRSLSNFVKAFVEKPFGISDISNVVNANLN
ncbi:MAG: response regulator [Candidatus Kryptoniota bacterium]